MLGLSSVKIAAQSFQCMLSSVFGVYPDRETGVWKGSMCRGGELSQKVDFLLELQETSMNELRQGKKGCIRRTHTPQCSVTV